jgi:cytochrome c biogenesis protein CcmG, thiol:disulfide interchange protein DsbE
LDNARGSRGVYSAGTTLSAVRPRIYWPVSLAAAALVALLTYGVASVGPDTSIDEALSKGERVAAPVRDLPRLGEDGTGSLADYGGKVVVLNVWASWCPPCKDEMPLLQRTHDRIAPRGGAVLGIDTQDATEDALKFLREERIRFPSLRDRDREYGSDLGVSGYPETFVIDRDGRIAARQRGPVTREWLDEKLEPLLEERA